MAEDPKPTPEPEATRAAEVRRGLEAVIFAAEAPVSAAEIRRALPALLPSRIPDLVSEINEELRSQGRPYAIASVGGGYQFRTRPEYAEVVRAGRRERKRTLSRAALETLAVIAYRQPITRAQVEELRSVDCSGVLKGLLEEGLIRIVGRRDAPGRPVLYGTGGHFLETFGLGSLSDLPALREFEESIETGTSQPQADAEPTNAAADPSTEGSVGEPAHREGEPA